MNSLEGAKVANSLAPDQKDQPRQEIAFINNAMRRGLFKPYEEALKIPADSWNRETWLSRVKDFSNDPFPKEIEVLACCYLFALALDPDVRQEDKEQLSLQFVKSLEKKDLKNFYYTLSRFLHPVMSTHILRYAPTDILEGLFAHISRLDRDSFEDPFVGWIKEVTQNNWALVEKQGFLIKLFDKLPKEKASECLYSLRLNSSEELFHCFTSICPAALDVLVNSLFVLIREYGEKILKEVEDKPAVIRLPFEHKNQRHCFLAWFAVNALDHSHSDLIATGFDEKDWQWLHERVRKSQGPGTPRVPCYAMKWMIMVSKRLSDKTLKQDSALTYSDVRLSIFFRSATEFVERESRGAAISDESYRELAKSLSSENLYHYIDTFQDKFKSRIMQYLVSHEPEKFLGWIALISHRPDDHQATVSSKLTGLFDLISAQNGLEAVIDLVCDEKQSSLLKLTVFAASKELRKAILKIILTNRQAGLQTLLDWVGICVDKRQKVKPFIKDALVESLYAILQQLDANLAHELKQQASEPLEKIRDLEGLDFLDSLLPVGVDLNNPITRQKEAVKNLRRHFRTPGILSQDRRKFLNDLDKDLRMDLSSGAFVEMLFHEFDRESWPFLFAFYEHDLHRNGNVDPHKWIAITAQTLNQMVGNPLLEVKQGDGVISLAMFHLYHSVRKTCTINKVIERFIEITTPAKFLATMHRFARSAFQGNSKGFITIVSESLNAANIEKPAFIAHCLKEAHEARHSRHIESTDLEGVICKEPFLKTDEERALVTRRLRELMDFEFLELFARYQESNHLMIKSLYKTDSAFCEQLFDNLLQQLCQKNKNAAAKLTIFQNLCAAFVDAGLDVFSILLAEKHNERRDVIKSWYSHDTIMAKLGASSFDWRLLRLFNPLLLYPTAFEKIHAMLSNDGYLSFYDIDLLLKAFREIECEESFNRQLFEKAELVQKFKDTLESSLHKAFELCFDAPFFALITKIVPEWSPRLVTWTIETVKEEKKQALSYGGTPNYFDVKSLLRSLSRHKVLDTWLRQLPLEVSKDLEKAIKEVRKELALR